MKLTVYVVYGVSQVLYKLFGVNTPIRKAWLAHEARKIQDQLDYEHYIRDNVNARINGVYTTKEALDIAEANNWF